MEEVYTPGIKTIAELSEYLGVTPINTLKAVFYISDGNLVLVSIRGDLEVNEIKLKNALKVNELRLATSQEVTMGGFIPGAASALDLKDVRSVADESIRLGCNFVVGGNRPDYHLKNANHPRDFQPAHIIDIAMAEEGQGCPRCAGVLKSTRGIEVGHIFKLGTFFTDSAGATYVDHEGHQRSVTMGCYGIGIGRLLGAAIEQNHDDRGIIFSPAIAPYQVHLVGLQSNRTAVREGAEAIERFFQESGVDVLYDDRDESPGAKLNDADLLGLPIRVVVSERSLQTNMVEIKLRNSDTSSLIPIEQAVSTVKNILEEW